MYLNCKTWYSFKYGTFSTDQLVKTAVDKGVTALTLTNINFNGATIGSNLPVERGVSQIRGSTSLTERPGRCGKR